MGTTYKVWIADKNKRKDKKKIKNSIAAELRRIDNLMSTWKKESEISRFNRFRSRKAFILSPDSAFVVSEALRISRLTAGAFDPTVHELVELWGFGRRKINHRPSSAQIKRAKSRSGYKRLKLKKTSLFKNNEWVALDLGGIAKGFAVDQIYRLLRSLGFKTTLIEIGGEVRAGNKRPRKGPWHIGIEKPNYDNLQRIIKAVATIENISMATSGDYRNFIKWNGIRFSHILDPRRGVPVKKGVASATIIGPQCVTADALATAILVLGAREGITLINTLPGYEAYIIEVKNGIFREHQSSGMDHFLKK